MTAKTTEVASADTVELRIPRKAEWVAVARLAVAAVASRMRFTIEQIEDVKLAVAEACTSAIQSPDAGAFIVIDCETDAETMRVKVSNSREDGVPAAAAPLEDDMGVGGLGVFLIRSLMDDVEYEEHPENGMHLVMVKKLSS